MPSPAKNVAAASSAVVVPMPRTLTERQRRVIAHMVAAVDRAESSDHPFSYFYARELFPADFYRDILANLPEKSAYAPINIERWRRPNGESTRDRFFLSREALDTLPTELKQFWREMTEVLTSPELKQAVFSKLATDIALRFDTTPAKVGEIQAWPRCTLLRDTEGYRIKPHTDGLEKIVTMQIYLPPDESQRDIGTVLYEEDGSLIAKLTRRSLKKFKKFEFLPNTGYAFAVNNRKDKKSWHGTETLAGSVGTRNTIMNLYRGTSEEEYY